jgi:hypothetical protein
MTFFLVILCRRGRPEEAWRRLRLTPFLRRHCQSRLCPLEATG